MKISTKGRYALRMLLDLAEHQNDGYIALKDIATDDTKADIGLPRSQSNTRSATFSDLRKVASPLLRALTTNPLSASEVPIV